MLCYKNDQGKASVKHYDESRKDFLFVYLIPLLKDSHVPYLTPVLMAGMRQEIHHGYLMQEFVSSIFFVIGHTLILGSGSELWATHID